jgi:hypothetical protein
MEHEWATRYMGAGGQSKRFGIRNERYVNRLTKKGCDFPPLEGGFLLISGSTAKKGSGCFYGVYFCSLFGIVCNITISQKAGADLVYVLLHYIVLFSFSTVPSSLVLIGVWTGDMWWWRCFELAGLSPLLHCVCVCVEFWRFEDDHTYRDIQGGGFSFI